MNTLTASIPQEGLNALESLHPSTPQEIDSDERFRARILEALEVAHAYAKQIDDLDYRRNLEEKLNRSNVRGSSVQGVREPQDVVKMLASVSGWRNVIANLKDEKIVVLQGILSEEYSAYTAYASIRELDEVYGSAGLGLIQVKKGYQHDDEYYLCTMARFSTSIITVQLKTDDGQEHLHQWFAGVELSSRVYEDDGDTIVRCNTVLPQVSDRRPNRDQRKGSFARKTQRN